MGYDNKIPYFFNRSQVNAIYPCNREVPGVKALPHLKRCLTRYSGLVYLQSSVTLCNLGVGATFGESVLHDLPRDSTVVTKTTCELLRVEQQDFRLIWEVSSSLSLSFSNRFLPFPVKGINPTAAFCSVLMSSCCA